MYKSKACTQRGGMHRRIHSEPSLTPAWTHPTCVLAKCGSPESDIPCLASSATRLHLRRGAWTQPPICTLLPFSPTAIIDCTSQRSPFPGFPDKTGEEEGASLKSRLNQSFVRSANGHPTDRENLAQRKIEPVGRRPHPRHVARGELWLVGI